ncbi:helix-turn-helix transcriptional regulator [Parvularcula lutaonensis]|uniref:Helix-turn-helix transcriptional regulator n=1 Tax=Parvularcula lutaonensis TaxID=491923 RepID=A0ABV7MBE6_9PROT|nr:helix-turn-helix transcriptional regulator [Parvularcula lutaonensis]GGY47349.1 transcriptional regulator [Parvularcula lutaonensis]
MKNRIRDLRLQKGWSQGELGEKVGVSRQAINAVERGKHDPSLLLAFKLADAFDLKVEDLFAPDLGERS